jgi:hypothetical protein
MIASNVLDFGRARIAICSLNSGIENGQILYFRFWLSNSTFKILHRSHIFVPGLPLPFDSVSKIQMQPKFAMPPISGLETLYQDRPLPPRPLRPSEAQTEDIENERLRRHNTMLLAENKFLIEEMATIRDELFYHTTKNEQAGKAGKEIRKGLAIIQKALSDIQLGDRMATKALKQSRQERGVRIEPVQETNEDIKIFANKNII